MFKALGLHSILFDRVGGGLSFLETKMVLFRLMVLV